MDGAGAYMAGTLGVATLSYLPWAVLCWTGIIFATIWGFTGFGIAKLTPEQKEMLKEYDNPHKGARTGLMRMMQERIYPLMQDEYFLIKARNHQYKCVILYAKRREHHDTTREKTIATQQAPGAIGPYSQAVQYGNLLFTSGQLGMDASGQFAPTVEEQANRSLNVKAILEAPVLVWRISSRRRSS